MKKCESEALAAAQDVLGREYSWRDVLVATGEVAHGPFFREACELADTACTHATYGCKCPEVRHKSRLGKKCKCGGCLRLHCRHAQEEARDYAKALSLNIEEMDARRQAREAQWQERSK